MKPVFLKCARNIEFLQKYCNMPDNDCYTDSSIELYAHMEVIEEFCKIYCDKNATRSDPVNEFNQPPGFAFGNLLGPPRINQTYEIIVFTYVPLPQSMIHIK
jgi:hypothetical protein